MNCRYTVVAAAACGATSVTVLLLSVPNLTLSAHKPPCGGASRSVGFFVSARGFRVNDKNNVPQRCAEARGRGSTAVRAAPRLGGDHSRTGSRSSCQRRSAAEGRQTRMRNDPPVPQQRSTGAPRHVCATPPGTTSCAPPPRLLVRRLRSPKHHGHARRSATPRPGKPTHAFGLGTNPGTRPESKKILKPSAHAVSLPNSGGPGSRDTPQSVQVLEIVKSQSGNKTSARDEALGPLTPVSLPCAAVHDETALTPPHRIDKRHTTAVARVRNDTIKMRSRTGCWLSA